jgi:hypothetical protein
MVDALVQPIIDDTADVTMGIFQGGKFSTDWAQKTFPFLTGQRGMKRSVWDGADIDVKSGYAVEVHLTKYMAKENLRVENVVLVGCSQYLKEQKTKGKVLEGFGRRLKMTWEIAKALFMPDFEDIAEIFAPKRRQEEDSGETRERKPRYDRDRDDRPRRPRSDFGRKPWVADGDFNKSWRDRRDDDRRERRPRRDDAEGSAPSEGEDRPPRREGGFFRPRDEGGEGFRRGPGRPRKTYDGDSSGGDRPPPRREGGFFRKREDGDRKPFFGNREGGERRGPGRPRKYGDDRPFGDRPPRRPRE